MDIDQLSYQAFAANEKRKSQFDLKGFLTKCLYHWPLFVIALLICLSAAFYYLKKTYTVYIVKATLLIKDDKKTPDKDSKLEDLSLVNSSKLIENEIEVLKSNQLITRVIKDLNLWVTYQKQEKILKADLYKAGPVIMHVGGDYDFGRHQINIVIKDANSFYIKNPGGSQKQLSFNRVYHSDFGTWKLTPTDKIYKFKNAGIVIDMTDPDVLALTYQKLIDVSLSNKLATALNLSVEDQNPQRGKDILNRLIEDYNNQGKGTSTQQAEQALYFINKRLDSLAKELNKSENSIAGFKSSQGITDITNDAQISLDDRQDNNRRLSDINVQLSAIESIERYVNSGQNFGGAPSTQGVTDVTLNGLIKTLADLQLQREKLLATTPETNPDFDQLNRQTARLKNEIKEAVKSIKSSLLNTKNKLQSFNSGFKSSIKDIPYQERVLTSKKRTQTSIENLYTFLLQKKEELSVNYASTLNSGVLIDAAYAGAPKKPIPALVYGLALFLGIGFPFGLLYIRSLYNTRIITLQQIKEVLKAPVIAEIPADDSKKNIVVTATAVTQVTEQFRVLRTKLNQLYDKRAGGRVTLVTSGIPGEGKNFISANLAAALSYTSRKTIIIELNMRTSQIAQVFEVSAQHAGAADFITSGERLSGIVQRSGNVPNLDVITAGDISQNPSELLENKQLDELFLQLRNLYDDIIINSPSLHMVPDAMITSRVADLALYVVRQGFTDKKELEFIDDLVEKKQLPNVNIVFNGIDKQKYGYGNSYPDAKHTIYTTKDQSFSGMALSGFFGRF